MTPGRLPADSVAGQQTQIFHISTGTRCNNNCGYLSLAEAFLGVTIRRSMVQIHPPRPLIHSFASSTCRRLRA